ncbi:MAG: murein L,D-transpeptidase [Novosphingobium sp.]|uniref:L,D-transpeptidase family protein n=1 Tax=Novosphingobium sp. TaxID=1874826 RepID=UPI0012C4EC19|nr:L,D-transpeptidase family protein [Novosphingobium sp.]MPS67858.1 murein L,D-transpeptidase [Novosphingobium sp.]
MPRVLRTLPLVSVAAALLLSACHSERAPSGERTGATSPGQGLAFADAPGGAATESADSLVLRAQVALDRLGFSSGVIDGKEGQSYGLALGGFQQARGLPASGRLDPATQQALLSGSDSAGTRNVVIPADFAKGPFVPDLPKDMAGQARFKHLGYRSMAEALAERFHTTPETLLALNGAGTVLGAGRTIRVPDVRDAGLATIEGDESGWADTLQRLGVAAEQPRADHVVVDKSDGALRVYDGANKLIAQFPVTTGSGHDPLPLGTWKIVGEARNPDYHFNPDLFWDAKKSAKDKLLPPGPNGPVGVVWLDLSKAHYGIHGTPEPQNIGRTESHGCVRLTNWDAARLAQMVSAGTKVVFQA